MNNWRLLLLALVAVFQPITSFSERNLVDGRQQCCDRQTDPLLRDSRPFLYETNRLAQPSSPLRRLNFRDETLEDRQVKQRVTLFSQRSTERSLLNIRDRNKIQSSSIISRSTRVGYRRIVSDNNGERSLDGQRRERNTLTRVSMMHRNVRINELSSRHVQSRDESRINRPGNERQDSEIGQSQVQDRMDIRTGHLRRLTLSRVTLDNLWMQRQDIDRVRISHNIHRLAERERMNVMLREQRSRDDLRRYLDSNNEHRAQERSSEQQRSLSENSKIVERVRDMKIRVNSRNQRDANRERLSVSLQQNNDRRQYRGTVKKNIDLRVSWERKLEDRRDSHDFRLMKDRNIQDRAVENRRDTKQSERLFMETRDDQSGRERWVESTASRRIAQRDIRVTDQRARSKELESSRNTRLDLKSTQNWLRFAETVRDSDATRKQTAYRNKMATNERGTIDDRFKNVEPVRVRDYSIMSNKLKTETEAIGNWQYIFYSLQTAYLCGLVMQMLTPNRYEKSKMGNLRWWPLASQIPIKVD